VRCPDTVCGLGIHAVNRESPQFDMIALLGRRDSPTDAVEDYCRILGRALNEYGRELALAWVRWPEVGWIRALRELWWKSRDWKNRWVLVQFTALSWSQRGFPFSFLAVLGILRSRRARIAVIFHDPMPYPVLRPIHHLRRWAQRFVMRASYRCADKSILTVPLDRVFWLTGNSPKASFIPVGANLKPIQKLANRNGGPGALKTAAVFGITGGGSIPKEIEDIAFAVTQAASRLERVRLITLGRGSREAQAQFRQALTGSSVEFVSLGILPAEEVSKTLAEADVLLFARGPLSTQKGSAIAGIACGLPLVAYSGPQTGPPITEAGVRLAPVGDREALATALIEVLTDQELRQSLRDRSELAHQRYFSWSVIAARFLQVLNHV